ncbi:hypothetical protein OXB_1724 [Bacillus sp. OxB-1]|uniref:DNA sulfur modification protein DndB n=1 Tax=Bacillus sp. (strain OxB-1) TaxID=98228 RepID=UPI000582207F|nr:DNA sulfur modification protein DndB [Bacillus sp. OxB-1]BAQ10195.1 hypothetical protein OXB_1724 [Bacillus sp. OxB-1]
MIIHPVFSKKQTMITYPLEELLQMLKEEQMILRETNQVQARAIRRYIFDNIMDEQVYLPPIVAYVEEGELIKERPVRLHVIDGSQRMEALSQLQAMMVKSLSSEDDGERKKGLHLNYMLKSVEISVQVFEGVSPAEADQMYIDFNTKGKKVSLSKRIAYDSRNSINQATNQVLQANENLRNAGVEQEKIAVVRPKNKNLLSLSQLRQLVALFLDGSTVSSKLAQNRVLSREREETIDVINFWFEELFKLHPVESIGDYDVSIFASFPLLYAVASYAIEGSAEIEKTELKTHIKRRMEKLRTIDWSRDNPAWRGFDGSERGKEKYFYLKNDKKNIKAITDWLSRKGGE